MSSHRVRFSIDGEQGGPVPPPPTRNPAVHLQRINGGRSRPQPEIHSPVPRAVPTQFSPHTLDSFDSLSYYPAYRGYPDRGHAFQNAPWVDPCSVQMTQTLSRQQGLGLNILPPRPVHMIEAHYQVPPYEVETFNVPPPMSSMGRSRSRNGSMRVQHGPWRPLNVPGQFRQLTPIMGSPYSGADGPPHSPVDGLSESSGDTFYEGMDDDAKFDTLDPLSKSSLCCIAWSDCLCRNPNACITSSSPSPQSPL